MRETKWARYVACGYTMRNEGGAPKCPGSPQQRQAHAHGMRGIHRSGLPRRAQRCEVRWGQASRRWASATAAGGDASGQHAIEPAFMVTKRRTPGRGPRSPIQGLRRMVDDPRGRGCLVTEGVLRGTAPEAAGGPRSGGRKEVMGSRRAKRAKAGYVKAVSGGSARGMHVRKAKNQAVSMQRLGRVGVMRDVPVQACKGN
ncbi:hypothetical protein B0H14DRAFT_2591593 [Mycena olivaceomarginata]|nr:hypothetical protein B0H14DRAFT_2591593 [Mycena olivaceomarginata]